jgi:hypothetical protein
MVVALPALKSKGDVSWPWLTEENVSIQILMRIDQVGVDAGIDGHTVAHCVRVILSEGLAGKSADAKSYCDDFFHGVLWG